MLDNLFDNQALVGFVSSQYNTPNMNHLEFSNTKNSEFFMPKMNNFNSLRTPVEGREPVNRPLGHKNMLKIMAQNMLKCIQLTQIRQVIDLWALNRRLTNL
jgi:hypothetical protein